MMELLLDPAAWMAFATLTLLEIVLGVDNIIFISILVGRLPADRRDLARRVGLGLAMGTRIALLLSLAWVMSLTAPFFTVLNQEISGRDIILLAGGLFLLAKSTREIHLGLEGEEEGGHAVAAASFGAIIAQIAVIDIVFSLDSVITAVGMAEHVSVMVAAIVVAVMVMMVAAPTIGSFVERHPTIKMLALSFLILIGMALIAEGLDLHIPKGYIYFAMAFSLAVEMLNIKSRKRRTAEPVRLRKQVEE
ncbi:MAG: TerC family protein [Nitrospirota bacterium]|nr:TerC family protein [Nitrospirota bacterium]